MFLREACDLVVPPRVVTPAVDALIRAARELDEALESLNADAAGIALQAVRAALVAVDLEAKGVRA